MSRDFLPKDKVAKPTSFAISEEERAQQAIDVYLQKTGKKLGAYVRELLKADQPNRLREIEKAEKLEKATQTVSAKYPEKRIKRSYNKKT